jgi:hypothetical protein
MAGKVAPWNIYLDLQLVTAPMPQEFDSVAYFGAGTCLLISSEALSALPDGEPDTLMGPLSDLHPYIARRLGDGSDDELSELPIPVEFQQLFRDWANGKVDFAGPPPQSQES